MKRTKKKVLYINLSFVKTLKLRFLRTYNFDFLFIYSTDEMNPSKLQDSTTNTYYDVFAILAVFFLFVCFPVLCIKCVL